MQGTVLAGRYRLEELLGEGGFGVVYRATQLPLGRGVAVKLMQPSSGDDGTRFAQEAALAQRLEHPNTVRILDFGVLPDGRPFIVWELLRGQTVAELVARRGALDPAIARHVTSQVLKSLMEAHAHGIVHRDIKPANVFVAAHPGEPYFVKVLDFGIAKDLAKKGPADPAARTLAEWSSRGTDTRGSQLMGTPRYMAPEQVVGVPVGPETDVYAVGLLLAEMMAGQPVWGGEDGMAILLATSSPAPVPLPERVTSSPLREVVERATRKSRAERYATASAMLAELEAVRGIDEAAISSGEIASLVTTSTGPSGAWPAHTPAGYSASFGSQATVAASAIAAGDRTAPPLQVTQAAGGFAPPRRSWGLVVGLSAAALLGVVGLAVGGVYVATDLSRTSEAERRKHASRDDESETEDAPRPEKLVAPKNVDWSKRKARVFDEEPVKQKLEKLGYKVTNVQHYGTGTEFPQAVVSLTKPPCAGSVMTFQFPSEMLAEANRKALADQPIMRVFKDDKRVIAVMVSRDTMPQGDAVCTDILAFKLTE